MGWLFTPISGRPNSLRVEARDNLLVIEVTGTMTVHWDGPAAIWSVTGCCSTMDIGGVLAGRGLSVSMQAASDATQIKSDRLCGVQISSNSPTQAPVVVLRIDGRGLAGSIGQERYHALVQPDGHLYVAAQPFPQSAAIDEWTGERLDVSGATPFGMLQLPTSDGYPPWVAAACDAGNCVADWSGAYLAPRDGDVRCLSSGNARNSNPAACAFT